MSSAPRPQAVSHLNSRPLAVMRSTCMSRSSSECRATPSVKDAPRFTDTAALSCRVWACDSADCEWSWSSPPPSVAVLRRPVASRGVTWDSLWLWQHTDCFEFEVIYRQPLCM